MKHRTPTFSGVMLNAYPDSIGQKLSDCVEILQWSEFKDVFSLFYILPTFFNSDLDRGFSIIDYDLNQDLVSVKDLEILEKLNIKLKFDIVLNHLSVASPQFKDLLKHGENSKYKDFFINWNQFWEKYGEKDEDGLVIPHKAYLDKLFMRKSGLPILNVTFPDGSEQPYWNTFYQKITVNSNGEKSYLGQMDVNAESELVWEFYKETLKKLKDYGCAILRLDAFAYLHKAVGETNFFNTPGTWDYLQRIKDIADKLNLTLLPEIHAEYGAKLHEEVANKGYQIYDFFLPGLLLHTIESKNSTALLKWVNDILKHDYQVVNMLGCHDGIPVLDLKGKFTDRIYSEGLLSNAEIESIMQLVIDRGGRVKNLYGANGKKISYYQINATYYSALDEVPEKLLLARAIQLFMPGIPQVWYLDLFAGTNDYEAADSAGEGGHKEINRTNLSIETIKDRLQTKVVKQQIELLRFRNTHQSFQGELTVQQTERSKLIFKWKNENVWTQLEADLNEYSFWITYGDGKSEKILRF